ncbi:extracellular solute-binding protein [Micromonospora rifamycinica]|uniref:extracellular solute-binding protein n=1 Tax=Micromonospora rifamycinica TaxID=291594 RepID=UPI00341B6448
MNLPTRRPGSRLLLPLTAATVVGVVMTALSAVLLPGAGPTPSPTQVSPPAAPAAGQPMPLPPGEELLIASGVDESQKKAREKAIQDWNDQHPDVPARIVPVYGNADAQRDSFQKLLNPALTDPVDIVNLDSVHLAEFAAVQPDGTPPRLVVLDRKTPDVPHPITKEEQDAFLSKPLFTCFWDQKLYALPYNSDVGLLFFPAGTPLPKNEAELPKAFAANPTVPPRVAIQLSRDEAFVVNVLEQLLAVNENLLTDDGSPQKVIQKDWEDALTEVRRKVKDGLLWDTTDTGRSAEEETNSAFKLKQAAAMRNWPVWFGDIQPRPVVRRLFGPGILGGQNLAVAEKSRHKAQAIELIRFLTSEERQQKLLIDGRFVPTIKATYTSEQAKISVPYLGELHDAVQEARPRPITPTYWEVSKVILGYLYPVVVSGKELDPNFDRVMEGALN